jgi:hypothetical protein
MIEFASSIGLATGVKLSLYLTTFDIDRFEIEHWVYLFRWFDPIAIPWLLSKEGEET